MKVASIQRHAEEVIDLLVDCGPLTGRQACEKLGWSRGRFDGAIRYARDEVCPTMGLAIPQPVPPEWIYQITTEWEPVEAGASYALGGIESRLTGIGRDVAIVLPHLERGTPEWRRANFLNKHLSHILGTLKEINDGEE